MKRIMKAMILIIAIVFLFQIACDSTEPKAQPSLSVEDVSCTEAWLKVEGVGSNEFILERDGIEVENFSVLEGNIIYDDSLQPNRTYVYEVSSIKNQESSNKITALTMDTTSHNFNWEVFEFGEHSSSVLYDVAIIDENNIWAVGEIYTEDTYTYDSLGNWIDPYNAVHWNGNEWELKRIYFNYSGSNLWGSIRTIIAFNENDIWFGTNIHWNGNEFEQPNTSALNGWSANKLWGSSSNDLYAVGDNGNIAHYNGHTWNKIESGTTLNIYDIFSNNGKDIYVSGGNFSKYNGILLKGNTNGFQTVKEGKIINEGQLFNPYFAGIAKTVWVSNTDRIYFGGNLLYKYKYGKIDLVSTLQGNYINGNANGEYWGFLSQIRGTGENDIILVGEGNTVRHFNGSTWRQLGLPYDYSSDYTWLAVSIKNNLIVTVGRSGRKAIIMKLKR